MTKERLAEIEEIFRVQFLIWEWNGDYYLGPNPCTDAIRELIAEVKTKIDGGNE
jgi:hypothetical protein